ncbi:MAG: T9SS type A sorting domain-containing protein, partial [Crocinitomicaceae bacterium]|nr:T9SS type A sorting domain-containing protein [Crocinitomicaceae bacterium]
KNYVFGQTFVGVENEFNDDAVSVFPVPSYNNLVTVSLKNLPGFYQVEIYNSTGELIKSVSSAGMNEMQINLESSGMYWVRINNGSQIINKKVIIL